MISDSVVIAIVFGVSGFCIGWFGAWCAGALREVKE
jgi:hypothetical protein